LTWNDICTSTQKREYTDYILIILESSLHNKERSNIINPIKIATIKKQKSFSDHNKDFNKLFISKNGLEEGRDGCASMVPGGSIGYSQIYKTVPKDNYTKIAELYELDYKTLEGVINKINPFNN
jgi:hypothetical protein